MEWGGGILEGLCPNMSWLVFIYSRGAEELRSEVPSGLVPSHSCCLQTLGERKRQRPEHSGPGVLRIQGKEAWQANSLRGSNLPTTWMP